MAASNFKKAASVGALDRRRRTRSLIARDGDFCHYCKVQLEQGTRSLDHVIPWSEGGSNALHNLVLACKPCNHQRGAMPYEEFVELRRRLDEPAILTQRPFQGLNADMA